MVTASERVTARLVDELGREARSAYSNLAIRIGPLIVWVPNPPYAYYLVEHPDGSTEQIQAGLALPSVAQKIKALL